MTQQAIAAIREAATKILYAVPGLEGPLAGPIGDEAETILRLLDAAEKDSACDVVMWGPRDPFYSCCRCGVILPGDSNFCPGCGRRIVKEEKD